MTNRAGPSPFADGFTDPSGDTWILYRSKREAD